MESTKLSALLVLATLALSSTAREMAVVQPECNSCQTGAPSASTPAGGITLPPVAVPKLPSLPVPSVPLPSLPLPPVSVPKLPSLPLPSVPLPPVLGSGTPLPVPPVTGLPPVTLPPVAGVLPPVTGVLPPVAGVLPPVTGVVPPVLGGGGGSPKHSSPKVRHGGRKACPPPPSPPTPTPSPASDTCPIDALKLGACVDLLGNEVHVGDANVQCCPLVKGVAGLSAAACLCTAIKAKVLDISVYVPIALKLLLNCGCAVPPGYTCA